MKSIDIPGGVIGGIKDSLDDILGVRDDIGAALMPVYFVTKTWTGTEPGDGTATEVKVQVQPSPRIVEMKNEHRIVPGGAVQLGDIFLKMISKNSYPNKSDIDGTAATANIEKFYEIDGNLYRVIEAFEKHLTWTVHIRKLSNQNRTP